MDHIASVPILESTPIIEEGPLTMMELVTAIKNLKTGKAAGKDGVPNDFWKDLLGSGLEVLVYFF